MEFAYAKKGLRDLCEIRATAEKQLGTQTAAGLRRRLADLDAATTIYDLIAEPVVETAVDEERAVRIGDGRRLVFRSNHNKAPVTAGKIDWTQVTRIQFLRIESDQ
ncbi:MAG: killer suppression protein HigA [Myxococcales bacterium]|nr:killer suppression protein HigA [Myxococcales bacterium]